MLTKPPGKENEDKGAGVFGTHPGDFGVVIVAGMITLVMVAILVLPSPFAKLEQDQIRQEKIQAQQAKIARQKEIDRVELRGTGLLFRAASGLASPGVIAQNYPPGPTIRLGVRKSEREINFPAIT